MSALPIHFPPVETAEVELNVNDRCYQLKLEPRTNLADALRDHCGLTATHVGCEQGVCGACTIEIDGAPQRSCLQSAKRFEGRRIRTLEAFADDALMAQLRAAFTAEHALQCGYCTPGMLMTARDIVLRIPDADEKRVCEELSGNLCRCTGYFGIVRAILRVLRERAPSLSPQENIHAA
ncbi:hypothetical protein GCM10007205_02540 [Oxalicibacterium flavum]|uniref:succinate dehydrogenase n=1 Tax=Oxalicibacterium flavum TaxID=179467 RepID=A0A8J2UMD1_9BURK|nr:(2Fe-2S)-binding protein [Oxalicibacterium flavum]GGB96755.1 hypothetical protein GCM10007205_02540 [Oxalicibacterium flavum]